MSSRPLGSEFIIVKLSYLEFIETFKKLFQRHWRGRYWRKAGGRRWWRWWWRRQRRWRNGERTRSAFLLVLFWNRVRGLGHDREKIGAAEVEMRRWGGGGGGRWGGGGLGGGWGGGRGGCGKQSKRRQRCRENPINDKLAVHPATAKVTCLLPEIKKNLWARYSGRAVYDSHRLKKLFCWLFFPPVILCVFYRVSF